MKRQPVARRDICEKVGNMAQIAGFKRYTLQEGKKAGINAVDIWNGSGMYLTIVCDRASDIASLAMNGVSLCWLSNLGVSAPAYLGDESLAWNNNFSGGMLATCGLTTAGLPSEDAGEQLKLHGPISNLPSEEIGCRTYWDAAGYTVEYRSKTYQATPFAETICLARTICVRMGDNTVHVHDVVENLGAKEVPFMLLYHLNFGYPLLDEGSKLYLDYEERFPTSALAAQTEGEIGRISAPDNTYTPRAYNHRAKSDAGGFGHASLVNEALELGATVRFDTRELGQFNVWKCLQKQNYVVGLEPCNCRTWGRSKERENGTLQMLAPGEAREVYFAIQVHEGEDEIAGAVQRYDGCL